MSSSESGVPSSEQIQRRASGVPSGPSMRKRGPPGRLAGIRATGMLTSPNVIVPDQTPCARTGFCSFRSGTLPSLRVAEARLERAGERRRGRLAARRQALRERPAPRLRLDEFPDARLILVVIALGLE